MSVRNANQLDNKIWSHLSAGRLHDAQKLARQAAERDPAAAILATYYFLVGLDFRNAIFWNTRNPYATHIGATWACANKIPNMSHVGDFIFMRCRAHDAQLSNVGFGVEFKTTPTVDGLMEELRKNPLQCNYVVKDQATVALLTSEYEAYRARNPHDSRVIIGFTSKDMLAAYQETPESVPRVRGIFARV